MSMPSLRRRSSSRQRGDDSPTNRRNATLCMVTAFIALGAALLSDLLPDTAHLIAGALALVALAIGAYTLFQQSKHPSRRARNRLIVGAPIALLALGLAIARHIASTTPAADSEKITGQSHTAPDKESEQPTTLFSSGWYGEIMQDGVWIIVTSFAPGTMQAHAFNKLTENPAAYATLTVINRESPAPIALGSSRVTAALDSGEAQQSLDIAELLTAGPDARALKQRLASPRQLTAGEMEPDLPLCFPMDFDWNHVNSITVTLSDRDISIPGRVMTAEEKLSLLDSPSTRQTNAPPPSKVSAEAWFKDF